MCTEDGVEWLIIEGHKASLYTIYRTDYLMSKANESEGELTNQAVRSQLWVMCMSRELWIDERSHAQESRLYERVIQALWSGEMIADSEGIRGY